MQEKNKPHVVFTYSLWKSEDALNNYRDSELFRGVWSTIKPWFGEKAEAWTVETYFEDGNFSANHSWESALLIEYWTKQKRLFKQRLTIFGAWKHFILKKYAVF